MLLLRDLPATTQRGLSVSWHELQAVLMDEYFAKPCEEVCCRPGSLMLRREVQLRRRDEPREALTVVVSVMLGAILGAMLVGLL